MVSKDLFDVVLIAPLCLGKTFFGLSTIGFDIAFLSIADHQTTDAYFSIEQTILYIL